MLQRQRQTDTEHTKARHHRSNDNNTLTKDTGGYQCKMQNTTTGEDSQRWSSKHTLCSKLMTRSAPSESAGTPRAVML